MDEIKKEILNEYDNFKEVLGGFVNSYNNISDEIDDAYSEDDDDTVRTHLSMIKKIYDDGIGNLNMFLDFIEETMQDDPEEFEDCFDDLKNLRNSIERIPKVFEEDMNIIGLSEAVSKIEDSLSDMDASLELAGCK